MTINNPTTALPFNKLISVGIVILLLVLSQSGCSNNGNESTDSMDNLHVVKAIYEGFAAGDMEAILDSMSEDIVWLHPGDPEQIPFAGKFEGKAGVVQFFETAFTRIDVLEQTIFSFEASGDKVLVVGYEHMQVKDTGKEYQSNWIHMYTLAAGQVIAFEEFIDTAALVSAFSSDPGLFHCDITEAVPDNDSCELDCHNKYRDRASDSDYAYQRCINECREADNDDQCTKAKAEFKAEYKAKAEARAEAEAEAGARPRAEESE